jgi:putative ABC transport system ATP-binding protein
MEPIISIDKIQVIYNQGKSNESRALEKTSLKIYPKEYVIIFGPSGCGKSTLLYSIAGLQRLTTGDITISGKSLAKMTKREMLHLHQSGIGLIFQAFYLIPSLKVLDNVCLPRAFRGESASKRKKDGMETLKRYGILEQAEKYPSELSGGQKQRVAIARALINKPNIVLADEPVGNLDSESARNVLQILKDLNEVDEQTIIMVTHNPEHLAYADRIIYMRDGRVIKEEVNKEKRPIEAAKEFVPKTEGSQETELNLLMNSFKSLLPQQVDMLLVPFKAKQLLSHLLSELTDEQVSAAEGLLTKVLFQKIDTDEFGKRLDLPAEQGGENWNRTRAENLSGRIKRILDEVQKIKTESKDATASITTYLKKTLSLDLDEEISARLEEIVYLRIRNRIGQVQVQEQLNLPTSKGGIGLYKQTAEKISRELEILMLLKYS